MAIIILAGIVVVVIGTIVLITVPVRHVEAVARDFTWRRRVDIGTRVWVKRKSKRQPKSSADIRNVETRNADDPDKLHYTYEERVWRNMRSVPASGRGQVTVRDPVYVLGRDEEVRRRSKSYQARFVSEDGSSYSAKVRFERWKLLKDGAKYQLGRNTFGHVRTIKPARPAVDRRPPERAQQGL